MDAVGGLLNGPRAQGAFLLRTILSPPWSIRIEDQSPLSLIAIVKGEAWLCTDTAEPRRLGPGDVAIALGPHPYTIAHAPAAPPTVIVHPGQQCQSLDGEHLAESMSLGVRTWGNDPAGSSVMLIGAYESLGEISQRLLRALPDQLVLAEHDWNSPLIPLLSDEIVKDEPGQEAVLDRLLDLLLIAVLRAWFARPGGEAPGWYRAYADPIVGRALRIMQNNPEQPWTVASLAAETGMSRAALARRFHELVGEPPMTFLTEWRLALAADLLREPDATVGSVARKVGYGSPFALSTAFKRVRGISPQEHRVRALSSV
jgi:AraC-like DNA-binding protein